MDGLRWWLLLFGVFVVAGVYLYSRREQIGADTPLPFWRRMPTIGGDSGDAASPGDPAVAHDQTGGAEHAADQKIVTLRLIARNQGSFQGDELILNMRGIGLRRGKFGIFHRFDGDEDSDAVFSAASLVEPGHFDIENIKKQALPGISLFLVLPGPIEGVDGPPPDDLSVFHAGTARDADGRWVTAGGRVLGVTALGADLAAARDAAYAAVDAIHWEGEHHRTDIAADALRGPGASNG